MDIIDRLRRSGISINREGELIHEGERIAHAGLRAALFRWLDRTPPPEGRYVLRLDAHRFAYVDVEDTPLVARSARRTEAGFALGLSDGSEEPLDPRTLTVDDEGILRCWVRGGVCEARLSNSAAAVVAEAIVLEESAPAGEGAGSHGPVLRIGTARFPLSPRRARA